MPPFHKELGGGLGNLKGKSKRDAPGTMNNPNAIISFW